MPPSDSPPPKLRWRCRRGMQELDVMLGSWLDRCWADAGAERRDAFSALLEYEDDLIWDWLTARAAPEARLQPIVEDIRGRFFPETGY